MNGRFFRIAFTACVLLIVIASAIASAVLPHHGGYFGVAFETQNGKWLVTSVAPDGPASKAGVRAGNVVDQTAMSAQDRLAMYPVVAGARVRLMVSRHGRAVPVDVTARPAPTLAGYDQPFFDVSVLVFALIYALVAVLIAFRAPASPATAAILAFILGIAMNAACDNVIDVLGQPYASAFYVTGQIFVGAILIGQFAFPLLFPPRHTKAWRAIAVVGIPVTALYCAVWQWNLWGRVIVGAPDVSLLQAWSAIAFTAVVIAAIANSVLSSTPQIRRQALWAAFGILIPLTSYAAGAVCTIAGWSTAWNAHVAIVMYASGLAVAYAVLRHRLGGLELVVSRAATFSVVSLALICAFLLSEWGLALILERSIGERFTATGQLLLAAFIALAVGISARSVHEVISRRLNRVFFAQRYRALEALHRFSLETDSAMDAGALTSLALKMLDRHVGANYVAIYRGSPEDGYTLQQSEEAELPAHLAADDETVLRLRRWNEPFINDEQSDHFTHAYVCPMTLRGSMRGFVVCGPKADHAVYLPDERETLATLTHRVGVALEWLGRPKMPEPNLQTIGEFRA